MFTLKEKISFGRLPNQEIAFLYLIFSVLFLDNIYILNDVYFIFIGKSMENITVASNIKSEVH